MSDIQIIGVDMAAPRDFSAVTSLCGNCNTVVDLINYQNTDLLACL